MKKILLFLSIGWLCTFNSNAQTISAGMIDVGDQCANVFSSLAADPGDTIYGFWRDGSGSSAVYKLIKWNGSSWSTIGSFNMSSVSAATPFDEASDDVSLAIDASGGFHVAIKGQETGSCCSQERGVAYGYSANGSSWSFTKIQSSTDPNGWLNYYEHSIKVDRNGNPHIVFHLDDANNPRAYTIRYYKYSGSWSGQTAFTQTGGACFCNEINDLSFDLDTFNRPHIAFQRETNGSGLDGGLWYVFDSLGTWSSAHELIAGATNMQQGYSVTLKVGKNDNKVYILSNDYNGYLKETTNASGSFSTSIVNGGSANIESFSMNAQGDKFVVYDSSGLRYAYKLNGGSSWISDTISSNYHQYGYYYTGLITNKREIMALYDVRPAGACSTINRELWYGVAKITTSSCTSPTVPTVTGGTMCPGGSVNLSISGTLNSATKWYIYTGSCGGTIVDSTSSSSFSVSPGSTTTYYIRGEGNCVTPGTCGSATVTVKTNSAITSVTAALGSVCPGGNDTLTANGASAGTGATLTWYTGTGGTGTNLGTGNPIIVSPVSATTYYARLSGDCNTVEASRTVSVKTNSAITSVTAALGSVCPGKTDTLTANGASAGTGATLTWYTGAGGTGTNLGNGNPKVVSPLATTTYYARLSGDCNAVEVSKSVTLLTNSAITSASARIGAGCPGFNDTVFTTGKTLGSGATFAWFTGAGGTGTNLGSSDPLPVTNATSTTYFARASGTCNTVEVSVRDSVYALPVISGITSSRNPTIYGYGPYECADLTVSATGFGALTYTWNPSGTGNPLNICPSAGALYTATVTDGHGCKNSDTIRQKVLNASAPYAGRVYICYNYPRRPYYYTLCIMQTQVPYYLGLGATLGPCGAVAEKQSPNTAWDGIADLYKFYPNPMSNTLNVEWFNLFNEEVSIDLLDMTGKVVKTLYNGPVVEGELSNLQADMTDLNNGMYLLRFSSNSDYRINKVQLIR